MGFSTQANRLIFENPPRFSDLALTAKKWAMMGKNATDIFTLVLFR